MKAYKSFWSAALILLVLGFAGTAQAGLVVFATGFSLPESISLVPAGYGSLGGNYFIPRPRYWQLGLGQHRLPAAHWWYGHSLCDDSGPSPRATVGRSIPAGQFRRLGWTVPCRRSKWEARLLPWRLRAMAR